MEPTIVYKKGGKHRGPKGIPFSYRGVSDEKELMSLLESGWFLELPVAVGLVPPTPPKENYGVVKSYDELSDDEKKSIGSDLLDGKMSDKEIRTKYDVHHLTLKKLKSDVLD